MTVRCMPAGGRLARVWAPEGPQSVVVQHQDRVPGAPFHPTAANGPAVQRAVMALVTPDEVLALPVFRAP